MPKPKSYVLVAVEVYGDHPDANKTMRRIADALPKDVRVHMTTSPNLPKELVK